MLKKSDNATVRQLRKDLKVEYRILVQYTLEVLRKVMLGKKVNGGAGLKRGTEMTDELLTELDAEKWFELRPADDSVAEQLERAQQYLEAHKKEQEDSQRDL